ncbi:MAG: Superoxide dismutase [Mn], partial [uncultured Solirubrobacteraceae bacterium]
GLRGPRPAVRLQRPGAARRRGDDARAPRQAPPGVRRQGERRPRGHGARRQARRGGPAGAGLPAGRQTGPLPQQRRRPLQPLALLGGHEPGRRRRAAGRAGHRDLRHLRLLRRLQAAVRGRGRRAVRIGVGLARARRRRAEDHLHGQPGLPRPRGPGPPRRQRRLGARLLPAVPEQAPGLPQGVVERRELAEGGRALLRGPGL